MSEMARLCLDIVCPVFREESVIALFHNRLIQTRDGLAAAVNSRVL